MMFKEIRELAQKRKIVDVLPFPVRTNANPYILAAFYCWGVIKGTMCAHRNHISDPR
jgi:hypothetical protein